MGIQRWLKLGARRRVRVYCQLCHECVVSGSAEPLQVTVQYVSRCLCSMASLATVPTYSGPTAPSRAAFWAAPSRRFHGNWHDLTVTRLLGPARSGSAQRSTHCVVCGQHDIIAK